MTSTEWISSAAAVAMLREAGVVDLRVLQVWASDGLLEVRAKIERVAGTIVNSDREITAVSRYFWGELTYSPVMIDWVAGVFETTTDIDTEYGFQETSWRISGVEFKNADLQKCLGIGNLTQGIERSDCRGILPASAKANDHKYEGAAHKAAEIVRTERVQPSKAFKRLANQFVDPMIKTESVERAMRHAYDLMYDKLGEPHQNDQD